MKKEWELQNGLNQLSLRNLPGRKLKWRWVKETGKLFREGKGGINWYRYQKVILFPKLFPFAKKCEKKRPGTLIQEDNAPAYIHYYQQVIYNYQKVRRLL